jgi:acetyltransferase-like isoleucine patch superfamily enzyme
VSFLLLATRERSQEKLIQPFVLFSYAASHPLDPAIRQGTAGPENGGPINVGADCWFGGNVTVLANVTIGRGCVIGAGSIVTKVNSLRLECLRCFEELRR